MNCHNCGTPQPDAAVISAAASINAKRNAGKGSRPGALGLVRNGCKHEPAQEWSSMADLITCKRCSRPIRWNNRTNTFLLVHKKEGK